jgi:rubrerythrin
MEVVDILKDILQSRISNQIFYNSNLITIRNPEVRQVLTQLRDSEMRAIVKLQQKIDRLQDVSGIISKIFPTKSKY